ncbi:MAG: alpha/beta hydrolase [Chitinophagaceae bacterium]
MKEIKRDHAIINCQVTGNGDTTLLFVHGSYNDQTYWKKQVDYFSKHYTVVTFDLPGHGKSGKERTDWSVKGFAEDVIEVIKELDLENVILIGHSLGAGINLIAATSYSKPIVGFIGIDYFKNAATALPSQSPQQALTTQESLIANFSATNEKYARMVLLTNKTPASITNRIIKDYRNAYKPMSIEITPEVFEMYATEKRLLPQLRFKLYLVNVDYMPTNDELLTKYAGHGHEVFHMKGTCHFPMLEDPNGLNELLQKAINKIGNDSQ